MCVYYMHYDLAVIDPIIAFRVKYGAEANIYLLFKFIISRLASFRGHQFEDWF